MAEFIDNANQKAQRASDDLTADGMDAFGKPVPSYRKDAALKHCRDMGLTDTNKATGLINRAVEHIERDEPYKAMEAITAYLDLTGAYRLLAVLCTADPEAEGGASGRIESGVPSNQTRPKGQKHPMVYDEWGF